MTSDLRHNSRTIAVLALSMCLLGCANQMGFSQAPSSEGVSPFSDELPGLNDPATQVVASVCETAESRGELQTSSESIFFDDTRQTCDWNRGGNLDRRDMWHQARTEQVVSVALPTGSTLCHVEFEFSQQRFRFDDHFWLTFNDVILAASIDYRDRFGVTNGYSLFDWSKLVGTRWDTSREGVWCLAGANCSWPRTDTEGTIRMDFRQGTYYAVTARDRSRTRHDFKLITVGDNDSTDCQHRPVSANVTLKYVKQ